MHISYIMAIAIFIVLFSFSPQNSYRSAGPETVTEEVKEWGMSESAWRDMHVVASILTGGTSLEFRKDETSGIYWPSYSSTTFTNPNADPAIKSEGAREERKKIGRNN